ncbi:hypothetical protein TWF751_005410 [Orbilia oligospora]|nr:hypothetical protein TWF751_005410 [Orbilia oligospora]
MGTPAGWWGIVFPSGSCEQHGNFLIQDTATAADVRHPPERPWLTVVLKFPVVATDQLQTIRYSAYYIFLQKLHKLIDFFTYSIFILTMLTPISNALYDIVVKVAVNQHHNELKKSNKNRSPSTIAEKSYEGDSKTLVSTSRESTSTESIYKEKSQP